MMKGNLCETEKVQWDIMSMTSPRHEDDHEGPDQEGPDQEVVTRLVTIDHLLAQMCSSAQARIRLSMIIYFVCITTTRP